MYSCRHSSSIEPPSLVWRCSRQNAVAVRVSFVASSSRSPATISRTNWSHGLSAANERISQSRHGHVRHSKAAQQQRAFRLGRGREAGGGEPGEHAAVDVVAAPARVGGGGHLLLRRHERPVRRCGLGGHGCAQQQRQGEAR